MPEAGTTIWVIVGLAVVGMMVALVMFAALFRKAGPNEALVVYGFRGTRIVIGRGTVVLPMIEAYRLLSLELMSFVVGRGQEFHGSDGAAVTVQAAAQVKVKSDPVAIITAAEHLLTKRPDEREGLIRQVMEGCLRGIIGELPVEQIVKNPEIVADRMRCSCAAHTSKMGLEVISFTVKEARDKSESRRDAELESSAVS